VVAVVVLQGAVDFREREVVGTRLGPSDRPEDVAARIEAKVAARMLPLPRDDLRRCG
jgi:hypothetical protein